MCRYTQRWHGKERPLFYVNHPSFSRLNTASLTLQDALKNGSGQAVVARDLPEPCKCPCLDHCQKKFTRKLILFGTQTLVLCSKQKTQKSCLRHLVSKGWIFFSESISRICVSQPLRS